MKPLLQKAFKYETIWAAGNVSRKRGYEKNYGTWWEISAHKSGQSTVTNLEGNPTLGEVIDTDMEGILGKGFTCREMLRTAFLDAGDHLSIQVHPGFEYAREHSDDYGKYETWYIVDAKPDAYLVAGTTIPDENTIKEAFEHGTIEKYLKKWPVKKGDYITIPIGTLHALGAGITAYEIGTNSDTTYRFYDYDRTDANGRKRPLNVKESFDVVQFTNTPHFESAQNHSRRIGDTPYFTVDELFLDKSTTLQTEGAFFLLLNLGKDLNIKWNDESIPVAEWGSVFIPANAGQIELPKDAHLLISRPRKEKQ